LGNGIAQTLSIECVLTVSCDRYEGSTGIYPLELTDTTVGRGGRTIRPSEEYLQFTGRVAVRTIDHENNTERNHTINAFITELRQEDAEISVKLNFAYNGTV